MIDPHRLKLSIGLITTFSRPAWGWFLGRLGDVAWALKVNPDDMSMGSKLIEVLRCMVPSVVFVDEGVRLRPNSPLWKERGIHCVVSVDIWRGKPSKEWWSCQTLVMSHEELGGVTNGIFKIHIALSRTQNLEFRTTPRSAIPAKFKQILDSTVAGIRCAIPTTRVAPLGQDAQGLLHWEKRLHNIEAPTVYSTKFWVRRHLSTKELCAVLDVPRDILMQEDGKNLLHEMKIPGKVRAQVIECVWQAFNLSTRKHLRSEPTEDALQRKRRKASGKNFDLLPPCLDTELSMMQAKDTVTVKSVKADDASVPIHLWDERCLSFGRFSQIQGSRGTRALITIRDKFLLRFWRRKVARDFWKWMIERSRSGWWRDDKERVCSFHAGCKAISYALRATWWEWDGGSFPFFWRWDLEFTREVRDGLAPRFVMDPPSSKERQRPNKNPLFAEKERSKVLKVIKRGYLRPVSLDETKSLMHYFSVPKGGDDIRMVYDGSKCGLNAATFAPWFAVPTSSSLERSVLPHTVQGDNDFGDMFLNFQLHADMQKYTGVDGSDLLQDPETIAWLDQNGFGLNDGLTLTWDRPAMGLTCSPYQSVQTGTRAKQLILGNRAQESNPFRWKDIQLNLPGDSDYDPTLPWISKRRADGMIAADFRTYIDDNRVTANDANEAWLGSSQIAKCCSWLGMQDAARKRRAPSMAPGAWAGTIIRTDGQKVEKMVSQERWDKTKEKIKWIRDHFLPNKVKGELPRIHHKTLESIRGFLVYVSRTYSEMVPYLKGIHLTLDSWRPGRAASGWKQDVTDQEDLDEFDSDGCVLADVIDYRIQSSLHSRDGSGEDKPPTFVLAVPRLWQDIDTLHRLSLSEAPPVALVRPSRLMVGYLVGDASGAGHGTSFLSTGSEVIDCSHGSWSEEASARSSNFRELANLVRRVEQLWKNNKLERGTELFIFTDNFVTESVFHKGAATSPYLHSLVSRLRMIQLHGGLFIHMLWIAGTRMIEHGTDGLSRGDFSSGVMAGRDFLSLLPLNKGAIDLSSSLPMWIREYLPGRLDWDVLTPLEWFTKSHSNGHFIWAPPPAIADVALEQMCESFLIRPWNAHVFICPAHMTYWWRKQLRKVSDLVFTIPVGGRMWSKSLHEPLVFALTCPLLAYSPWRVSRSKRLAGRQSVMPKVWSEDWQIEGNLLRQLWLSEVPSDPEMLWGLAPQVLHKRPDGSIPRSAS
jgi:hypothetical protein